MEELNLIKKNGLNSAKPNVSDNFNSLLNSYIKYNDEKYLLKEILGTGTEGCVYKAKATIGCKEEDVALKL